MENKHTIYLNMCHHYRKILNAKPCVDTSPPKVLQIKTNNSWRYNRVTSSFHQQIPKSDTKKQFQRQDSILKQNSGPVICQYYYRHHLKDAESNNLNKSFTVSKKPFSPTILKSEARSKLINLRVYHPPRKKRVALKISEPSQSSQIKRDDPDEEILCNRIFDKTEVKNTKMSFSTMDNSCYSEESSEDSAYNEGECIMSGDSRGSTPQNSSNAHKQMKNLSITTDNNTNSSKLPITSSSNAEKDILCIQFLKDVTNDILKKNIFTNKALKGVFQQHVQINKYELSTEKMLKEICKLQERLGVPKKDKFDDEDYGLGKDIFEDEAESIEDTQKGEDEVQAPPVVLLTSKDVVKDETNKENINEENDEGDDFDENYSDNFSDDNSYVSRSEELTDDNGVEEENSTNNDEVASVNNEETNEDADSDVNSDIEKNYEKTASNSESDTDVEISEAC